MHHTIITVPTFNGERLRLLHYLAYPDGRIFSRYEVHRNVAGDDLQREWSVWEAAPLPEAPKDQIVGTQVDADGQIIAICRSGKTFCWSGDGWQDWAYPVPGTEADT